jgi:hypothetical protein
MKRAIDNKADEVELFREIWTHPNLPPENSYPGQELELQGYIINLSLPKIVITATSRNGSSHFCRELGRMELESVLATGGQMVLETLTLPGKIRPGCFSRQDRDRS